MYATGRYCVVDFVALVLAAKKRKPKEQVRDQVRSELASQ